jgi:hypothetical protein
MKTSARNHFAKINLAADDVTEHALRSARAAPETSALAPIPDVSLL